LYIFLANIIENLLNPT